MCPGFEPWSDCTFFWTFDNNICYCLRQRGDKSSNSAKLFGHYCVNLKNNFISRSKLFYTYINFLTKTNMLLVDCSSFTELFTWKYKLLVKIYSWVYHESKLLALILLKPNVISLCHQYRARPGCTSMQSDQALYCWQTNFKFSSWYL